MKRIILVVFLVVIAGVAGVVRSHSRGGSTWPLVINGHKQSAGDVRDEIRKSYELAPGTRVEVSGINGWVKIETSDSKTADIYIERSGASQEVLNRRKITIDNAPSGLIIRGEKTDGSFLSRLFGSSPTELVTLKLPRQISLLTSSSNGCLKAFHRRLELLADSALGQAGGLAPALFLLRIRNQPAFWSSASAGSSRAAFRSIVGPSR